MAEANKTYHVFISYRRTGASAEARVVKLKLLQHGLRAFLDVDDLEPGHFNLALLKRIAECPNFIVILSPHCLDPSADEQDWLRQEITQAVKTERNIVPIIMDKFEFPDPETLPAEFKDLSTYQSINYSHVFFDATMGKLIQHLRPLPATGAAPLLTAFRSFIKARSLRFWLSLGLVLVIVIGLAVVSATRFGKGHWTAFYPLPTARRSLMAASIGTMLCAVGGENPGGDLATLEVNNIATTDGWRTMNPLPKIDSSLSRHDLSMIRDTKPPEMDTWHEGRYQGAVAVVGGKLYVIGGWRKVPPYPSSLLQVYDPPTNTWSAGAPMPIMSGCSSAGVIDGKIYVLTPCDGHPGIYNFLHVYDPLTDKWATKDSAPHQHSNSAAGVIDGKFYVVGGIDGSNGYSSALDVFNPVTGTWSTKAPMPTVRAGIAGGVINGKLYAAGGMNQGGVLSVLEVYDPTTDTWGTEESMPTARMDSACGVIDGKLYVIGGEDDKNRIISTVEVFTPS
jgi:N-acetylneuraminic acid mutarotase